jgi:hypothetical protein
MAFAINGSPKYGPSRRRLLSRSTRGRQYLRRHGFGGPPGGERQRVVGSFVPQEPIGPAGRTARVVAPTRRRQASTLDLAQVEHAAGFPGAPY